MVLQSVKTTLTPEKVRVFVCSHHEKGCACWIEKESHQDDSLWASLVKLPPSLFVMYQCRLQDWPLYDTITSTLCSEYTNTVGGKCQSGLIKRSQSGLLFVWEWVFSVCGFISNIKLLLSHIWCSVIHLLWERSLIGYCSGHHPSPFLAGFLGCLGIMTFYWSFFLTKPSSEQWDSNWASNTLLLELLACKLKKKKNN